jgi:hypothetical protein
MLEVSHLLGYLSVFTIVGCWILLYVIIELHSYRTIDFLGLWFLYLCAQLVLILPLIRVTKDVHPYIVAFGPLIVALSPLIVFYKCH